MKGLLPDNAVDGILRRFREVGFVVGSYRPTLRAARFLETGILQIPGKAAMRNQAEANLSALIESTDDPIWSVDLKYGLIYFNRAFQQDIERISGIRVAVGMRTEEFFPPEQAALRTALYERVLWTALSGPNCRFPMAGRWNWLST